MQSTVVRGTYPFLSLCLVSVSTGVKYRRKTCSACSSAVVQKRNRSGSIYYLQIQHTPPQGSTCARTTRPPGARGVCTTNPQIADNTAAHGASDEPMIASARRRPLTALL
jgi:hypothetical protein